MNQDDIVGLVIDDKYRLDRKIGEGGMGAVYLGTQLMVDRNVAIKLLHGNLSGHDRIKQRFEVEAKAIGRMNHPNCITLYDFGYSSELNAFYMVMEFLDGTPMHKKVIEGVTPSEALDITRQISLALDHAHHQGILHRDLKPENVMLTQMTDGTLLVKVLDFGIARIFQSDEKPDPEKQNRLTRAGEVFGTPAYISPEQARGERDLTPASDLYSLGIMLFEMLEGKLPFWGETAIDTIMLHVSSPVPQLTRIDIPAELKQLVYALLSKAASERPQSGKELADRLAAIDMQMRQPVAIGAHTPGMQLSSSLGMGLPGQPNVGPSQGSALSQEFPLNREVPQATIPELTRGELDEWSKTENTVVGQRHTRPPSFQTTPPGQPLRPPSPASDASSSNLHAAPPPGAAPRPTRQPSAHPTQFGEADDSLELKQRSRWLGPAVIFLAILLLAGGAVALMGDKLGLPIGGSQLLATDSGAADVAAEGEGQPDPIAATGPADDEESSPSEATPDADATGDAPQAKKDDGAKAPPAAKKDDEARDEESADSEPTKKRNKPPRKKRPSKKPRKDDGAKKKTTTLPSLDLDSAPKKTEKKEGGDEIPSLNL